MNPILSKLKEIYTSSKFVNIFVEDNIHENYFKYRRDDRQLMILDTPKALFLYTFKGGSTFIENSIIKPSRENEVNLKIKGPINGKNLKFKLHTMTIDDNVRLDNDGDCVLQELIKSSKGKSKKDLIIVTRNPIIKWISGILMEIQINVKKDLNEHRDFTKIDDGVLSNYIIKFLKKNYELSYSYSPGHCVLFNKFFYLLLTSNNIDKSKIKIVDLDNKETNFSSILMRYYPEIEPHLQKNYWTQSNNYDKLFIPFIRMKKERTNIENLVRNEIYEDMMFYNLINEIYKDNIIYE